MEQLVTRADFENVKPLPASVDNEALDPAILRVQRGWVRDALGKALYRDIHANPTTGSNPTLLSGGTYTLDGNTVDFYGLKPAICAYTYAILMKDKIRLTRSGAKVKQGTESTVASPAEVNKEYKRLMGIANSYMQDALEYLQTNSGSFPLWDYSSYSRGPVKIGTAKQPDNYSEDEKHRLGRNFNYWI